MSRPKKGEKGHEKAVNKWRETMIERYGKNWREHFKKIGSKGGKNGKGVNYRGGFASNPALASIAGAKGGRCSTRRSKSECDKEWDDNKNEIMRMYYEGYTIKEIANDLYLNYHSIRRKIQEELKK